jgi:hypothetical protein
MVHGSLLSAYIVFATDDNSQKTVYARELQPLKELIYLFYDGMGYSKRGHSWEHPLSA